MIATFLFPAFAALVGSAGVPSRSEPQDVPAASVSTAPAAPIAEAARLARIVDLAVRLQDPAQDPLPLATEAVRLAGFVIWDEARQPLAEPLGAPRLGLAITDAELRAYTTMMRAGQSVQRDDLIGAVDVLYRMLGAEGSVAPFVLDWLRRGADTGNPSVRALAVLLQSLGNQRAGAAGRLDGAADVALDPLQALLLLRVVTEDLGTPLRRAIGRGEFGAASDPGKDEPAKKRGPFAQFVAIAEPPGWAEDAYAGGITGLFGEVAGKVGQWGKGLSDGLGKANALMTICKFVATYTFLRGEVRVEAPGQPLVRTKDADPGEVRTLVARFWIDGTRVTDWMKEHRTVVALAGLDLDMPKTGALKGIETDWDIAQDRHSTKTHLIQTVRGTPDISKIKADDDGEARIQVEGCPQRVPLDPKKVMPLAKVVSMVVTPQVKSTEMQQDLVDAVTGAIGLKDGPSGLLTPIIETLYRLKWKGGVRFDLQVRDWQAGESIGQGEVVLRANGHRFTRTTSHQLSLARSLVFTDVHMNVVGGEPLPPLDPDSLKHLPATYREQIEAGRKQLEEFAKKRAFHAEKPGSAELHVHDREFARGEGDGCVDEKMETRTTWDGDVRTDFGDADRWKSDLGFSIACDLENKTATLLLQMQADARVETVMTGGAQRAEVNTERMSVFSGVQILPPFDKGIVIPLQETEIREMNVFNYHGAVTVPFKFGPQGRYDGSAIVSYSVTRKVAPPKAPKPKRR